MIRLSISRWEAWDLAKGSNFLKTQLISHSVGAWTQVCLPCSFPQYPTERRARRNTQLNRDFLRGPAPSARCWGKDQKWIIRLSLCFWRTQPWSGILGGVLGPPLSLRDPPFLTCTWAAWARCWLTALPPPPTEGFQQSITVVDVDLSPVPALTHLRSRNAQELLLAIVLLLVTKKQERDPARLSVLAPCLA